MSDKKRHDFNTSPLDPKMLETPFSVKTNWHVLTGAACTGKSTLIDMLAERGFQVVPESARQYFEREMGKGRTFEEVFKGKEDERNMKDLQLSIERSLRPKEVVFLDRALPDSLTFYRTMGMDPNEFLPDCFHHHYASIFVLDRLAFQKDCVRIEDDVFDVFVDEWLARDYGDLGYPVVRMPVMPPEERLGFLLNQLDIRELK